mmetsp:Transcript_15980/g.31213  ORF Transcript_15980/g.31213 Transcript_15980/m.31213 type:complete len:471 (+) Transcript_15980:65-1477(+)|eukprot:CAMPEP_0172723448 /NCGR_PEP_ID=MMETSP1074-20121228/83773_1 /TAXON_ID=2916 /ORGANISM="Ceratium fusus, Strain PA161109" /LENGTH=470 /DNA_ID=CAMNT_0013549687 /DNA_START=79 /DNA_END=1491 /DNA_ORIENTATION=+
MRSLRRERTVAIAQDEIDFMVLQFSCIDSSVLSTIGKHCKETTWKIAAGGGTVPIDIKLDIDKSVGGSPQVSVKWDGNKVFPVGAAAKAKLKDDLIWKVPFRGMIKGLTVPDFFELRAEHNLSDDWYRATLLEQRSDGLFKALAKMPDGNGGIKEVNYPAVRSENIREAAEKKPVCAPQRELVLKIPQDDPLRSALLSVDDREHITHFFARPTPPPSRDGQDGAARLVKPRILFKVSQDRQNVVVDAGHAVLSHFLSSEIRTLRQFNSRTAKSWTFQFGPFAEHLVEIERRYKSSKAMTLSVDGEVLCEGEAEDIDSRPGMWECRFQLIGERYLDWEVYEHDVDGRTLDSTDIVRQRHKYSQECIVSMPEGKQLDVATAKLAIGGYDFQELPQAHQQSQYDERLELAPEALLGSYGLAVPYKVNEKAPMGFSAWADKLRDGKLVQGHGLFFCCGSTPLGKDEIHRSSLAE